MCIIMVIESFVLKDFSSTAVSLSTIAVLIALTISVRTLIETIKQRSSTYRPLFSIKYPNNFTLKWTADDPSYNDFTFINKIGENSSFVGHHKVMLLPFFNTGLGSINALNITFDFDIGRFKKKFPKDCNYTLETENGKLIYSNKNDKDASFEHITTNKKQSLTLDSVPPSNNSERPTVVAFPQSYSDLVAAICFIEMEGKTSKNLIELLPPLKCNVKYFDIGGEKYEKKYSIRIKVEDNSCEEFDTRNKFSLVIIYEYA